MNELSKNLAIASLSAVGALAAMEFDNRTQEQVVPAKTACYSSEITDTSGCVEEIDRTYQAQYLGTQILMIAGIGGALYGGYQSVRIARES